MFNNIHIVGDEYASFAQNDAVLTLSQLRFALSAQSIDFGVTRLQPGLGLDVADLIALQYALCDSGAPASMVADFDQPPAQLALTHKRAVEHVLIGPIERETSGSFDQYICTLRISALNDRLSDHVTGQHIGGMLLVEAARQAVVAVLELEYGEHGRKQWGLAWSAMQVAFKAFVFPMAAKLRVRCSKSPVRDRLDRPEVRLQVTVEQASLPVCELAFDITLVEASVLKKMEAKSATRALGRAAMEEAPASNQIRIAI